MKKNNVTEQDKPKIIKGNIFTDKRGSVSFVNDFIFNKIKRFYIVENAKKGDVRAWHGHKREEKYIFVLSGSALVGAVQVDNWKNPSKELKVYSYTLSADKPAILHIPKGYANGFKSLTKDAKVMFLSTFSLEQTNKDDFRFEPDYWDIWR
jgi:dTDP-4-dehydrorhamnose 3,5-epimerase-like enzyme